MSKDVYDFYNGEIVGTLYVNEAGTFVKGFIQNEKLGIIEPIKIYLRFLTSDGKPSSFSRCRKIIIKELLLKNDDTENNQIEPQRQSFSVQDTRPEIDF